MKKAVPAAIALITLVFVGGVLAVELLFGAAQVAVVNGAAAEVGVALDDQIVTGHAVDHPVTFAEGAYLKAVYATANRL